MNAEELNQFEQAAALNQSGRKTEAYTQFKALARRYPTNASLLLWIAYTTPHWVEAETALHQVSLLEPNFSELGAARQWVARQGAVQNLGPGGSAARIEGKSKVGRVLAIIGLLAVVGVVFGCAGLFIVAANSIPTTNPTLRSITCPSRTTCYAVGEITEVTTDGGKSWQRLTGQKFGSLQNISCPNPSTCYAVDSRGRLIVTTNGGKTWSVRYDNPNQILLEVTCPSVSQCYALAQIYSYQHNDVSNGILVSSDSGATWNVTLSDSISDSDPYNSIFLLSCPSPTTCYALDEQNNLLLTTDSGDNWSRSSRAYPSLDWVYSLACPSEKRCFVVGDVAKKAEIYIVRDGGQSWENRSASALQPFLTSTQFSINAISCPDQNTCYAAGHEIICSAASSNSPANSSVCTPGGGGVLTTIDGGQTWSAQSSDQSKNLDRLTCPAPSTCYGLDTLRRRIVATTDGGQTWQVQKEYGHDGN